MHISMTCIFRSKPAAATRADHLLGQAEYATTIDQ